MSKQTNITANDNINKNNNRAADEADVWDDTALIKGWDDAVAEYQRYHSAYHQEIGSVPTTSSTTAAATTNTTSNPNTNNNLDKTSSSNSSSIQGNHAIGSINTSAQASQIKPTPTTTQPPPQPQPLPQPAQRQQEPVSPPVPTSYTAASTQNEMPNPPLPLNNADPELKNLLMSWYWAGYYHGLYEGKNSKK